MSIDYLSEYEVLRVFLPHELSDLAPVGYYELRLWPPQLHRELWFGRGEPHCMAGFWRESDSSQHFLMVAYDTNRNRWCAYAEARRADAERWFEEVRAENSGFLHWWDG